MANRCAKSLSLETQIAQRVLYCQTKYRRNTKEKAFPKTPFNSNSKDRRGKALRPLLPRASHLNSKGKQMTILERACLVENLLFTLIKKLLSNQRIISSLVMSLSMEQLLARPTFVDRLG